MSPRCIYLTKVKFDVISCNINVVLSAKTKLKQFARRLTKMCALISLDSTKNFRFWASFIFFALVPFFARSKPKIPFLVTQATNSRRRLKFNFNNPEAKNSSALFQCRFFLENQSEFICNYWITDTREIIARLGKPCIAMWTKRVYICQEIVPDSLYL